MEKHEKPRNLELENDGYNDTMRHLLAPFQNIDGRYVSRNLLRLKTIEFLEKKREAKKKQTSTIIAKYNLTIIASNK